MFSLGLEHPERLWWLLLLPVLFWLALPPRPRTVVWTPHLPQWAAAQQALRRRPPRLRGIRFVLLAIACCAAVVAHAGLVLPGRPGPDRLLVLLDASASMQARDAFAAAREKLRAAFATLPEHIAVTLLRCGGPALRREGPSALALQDLGLPEGGAVADLAELATHAATEGTAPLDTVVWTLTDGQGQTRLPAVGALSVLGSAGANAAVLGVNTIDHWPLPEIEFEATVVAYAGAAVPAELRCTGAIEKPLGLAALLQPGVPQTLRGSVRRSKEGGAFDVRIVLQDDVLPSDDAWRAELPPLPAPRIAVLGEAEGGPFAAVAAEALAAEVGGVVVPAQKGADVGLLLVDGGEASIVPGQLRAVCFGNRFAGAAEPLPWLQPVVADWDRAGPLTAGLDLSELRVNCAFPATLPAGEPFLWGSEPGGPRVPLAVVCGKGDTASVHFAFRLQDSNLPLLPAFPQLLRRAFVRTYGAGAAIRITTPPPPAGEQDLWQLARAEDRALPEWSIPDRPLGPWLLLVGLLALTVRAFWR